MSTLNSFQQKEIQLLVLLGLTSTSRIHFCLPLKCGFIREICKVKKSNEMSNNLQYLNLKTV